MWIMKAWKKFDKKQNHVACHTHCDSDLKAERNVEELELRVKTNLNRVIEANLHE